MRVAHLTLHCRVEAPPALPCRAVRRERQGTAQGVRAASATSTTALRLQLRSRRWGLHSQVASPPQVMPRQRWP